MRLEKTELEKLLSVKIDGQTVVVDKFDNVDQCIKNIKKIQCIIEKMMFLGLIQGTGSLPKDFYRKLQSSFVSTDHQLLSEHIKAYASDIVSNEHVHTLYCCHKNKGKTYALGKEFLGFLKEADLGNIECSCLPEVGFAGVIKLPFYITDSDGDRFNECTVAILRKDENSKKATIFEAMASYLTEFTEKKVDVEKIGTKCDEVLIFTYKTINNTIGRFTLDLSDRSKPIAITAKDLIYFKVEKNWGYDEKMIEDNYAAHVKIILNILVYIKSGNPDLREFKNDIKYKKNKIPVKKDRELSTSDIILVGFNYKKAIIHRIDETTVSSHFRWQRCGKELSQVKLVCVSEHTRSFKKSKD